MNHRKTSKPSLKYKILIPNQYIVAFKRAFMQPCPNSQYQLAVKDNMAIRRYRTQSFSFEKLIADCQWRFLTKAPIVRCLYAELLSPSLSSKRIDLNIYTDHISVPLSKMKKLLLTQAFFIIKEAIKAYEILFQKYSAVSITQQTIGLNLSGQTIVWINENFNSYICEENTCKNTIGEIIKQLFLLISLKCQQTSSKLLINFYQHHLSSPRLTFHQLQKKMINFRISNKIKLLENLKYLVNQNNLLNTLQELKMQVEGQQNKNALSSLKTPRFSTNFLSKKSIDQVAAMSSPTKINLKKPRTTIDRILFPFKFVNRTQLKSQVNPSYTNNHISSAFISSRIVQQKNEYDIRISPFVVNQIKNMQNSDNSLSQNHKCKVQSSRDCIRIINHLKNNQLSQTTLSIQNKQNPQRNFRCQQNIFNSDVFNKIQIKQSIFSIKQQRKIEKIERKSFNESPKMKNLQAMQNMRQYSSKNTSPYLNQPITNRPKKISINLLTPDGSLHPTFHMIPQQDHIIERNEMTSWKNTVTNLLQTQSKLNTSITEGPQESTYLSDVRLQKFDTLSRQLTQSIIPIDPYQNISIRSIQIQQNEL